MSILYIHRVLNLSIISRRALLLETIVLREDCERLFLLIAWYSSRFCCCTSIKSLFLILRSKWIFMRFTNVNLDFFWTNVSEVLNLTLSLLSMSEVANVITLRSRDLIDVRDIVESREVWDNDETVDDNELVNRLIIICESVYWLLKTAFDSLLDCWVWEWITRLFLANFAIFSTIFFTRNSFIDCALRTTLTITSINVIAYLSIHCRDQSIFWATILKSFTLWMFVTSLTITIICDFLNMKTANSFSLAITIFANSIESISSRQRSNSITIASRCDSHVFEATYDVFDFLNVTMKEIESSFEMQWEQQSFSYLKRFETSTFIKKLSKVFNNKTLMYILSLTILQR